MFNMFGTKYDFKDPSRLENKFRKSKASFFVSIKIETHLFGVSLSEFSDSALLGKFRIKSHEIVSSGYSVCAFVGTGTGGPLIVGRKHDSSQISLGRRIIRPRFASCHFHLYRKAINPSFENLSCGRRPRLACFYLLKLNLLLVMKD